MRSGIGTRRLWVSVSGFGSRLRYEGGMYSPSLSFSLAGLELEAVVRGNNAIIVVAMWVTLYVS